jgi:hypothetical protein
MKVYCSECDNYETENLEESGIHELCNANLREVIIMPMNHSYKEETALRPDDPRKYNSNNDCPKWKKIRPRWKRILRSGWKIIKEF